MSIKNGDLPAMPVKHDGVCLAGDGLSKRERFAMAMAQGILANPGANLTSDEISTATAEIAVKVADALLAELEKSK